MAKYRVLEKSFINNAIVDEGDEVDYSGEPGPNLELIEKARPGRPARQSEAEQPAE